MLRRFVLFIMTWLATLVPAIPGAVLARIVAGLCAGLTSLRSTLIPPAGVALSFNYLIMGISTNGQVVAFLNDGLKLADGRPQLFVRNLATETTKLITVKYDGSGPST